MDARTFKLDKISVEVAARTIEFWRGEYAKRRVFAENKEHYQTVVEAMKALKGLAEHLFETAPADERLEYERDYEVIILDLIADGRLKKLNTPQSDMDLVNNLQTAFELSTRYGYVIADLSIDHEYIIEDLPEPKPLFSRKKILLNMIEELKEGYWKKILKFEGLPNGSLDIEQGIWIPRYYGPNATPWHRTHILSDEPFPTIERYEIKPDVAFAVEGIGDDEFQIRSTVGKIETDLCKLRIYELHKKQAAILSKLKALALNSENMLYEERQLFKELDPTALETFMETKIHQNLIDSEEFKKLSMQFPPTSKKEVRTARSQYVNITKEMLKLFKRLTISTREMLSGPYRGENAEVSRAKGIYLWDTVHIEGKTDSEALEDLKSHITDHCEGLLEEDSPKDNKQIKRLRITEECILKNRFLPMS